MTTRPTVSPLFATDATLGTGAESALTPRLDPGAGVRARGLLANTRSPARWFNFLLGLAGDWTNYLKEKTDWLFSPKNFGAVGDGVADDTAAILAAATACAAAGGGVVVCTAGTYRLVAELALPVGVSIKARGVVTFLKDHASANTLSWASGADSGCGVTVEDIRFEAAQNNTGVVWNFSAAVAVAFVRCSLNVAADKLRGRFSVLLSTSARVKLHDCVGNYIGTVNPGFEGSGELSMVGGSFSVPGSYASTTGFIDVDRSIVARVAFTQLLSTVGGFAFIFARSTCIVKGCRFRTTDNGAADLTYAVAVAGSLLAMSGNDFGSAAIGYCYPVNAFAPALDGSTVQLLPADYRTNASGTTTLLLGFRSYSVQYTGTVPTVQLPNPIAKGQELQLTLYNLSGGTLGFSVTNVGFKASNPTPNNNTGASALFVASDPTNTGTLVWSQVGGWATITP